MYIIVILFVCSIRYLHNCTINSNLVSCAGYYYFINLSFLQFLDNKGCYSYFIDPFVKFFRYSTPAPLIYLNASCDFLTTWKMYTFPVFIDNSCSIDDVMAITLLITNKHLCIW